MSRNGKDYPYWQCSGCDLSLQGSRRTSSLGNSFLPWANAKLGGLLVEGLARIGLSRRSGQRPTEHPHTIHEGPRGAIARFWIINFSNASKPVAIPGLTLLLAAGLLGVGVDGGYPLAHQHYHASLSGVTDCGVARMGTMGCQDELGGGDRAHGLAPRHEHQQSRRTEFI